MKRLGPYRLDGETIPIYISEHDCHKSVDIVCAVVLSPLALDFLCEYLPQNDGYTDDFKKLREEMKQELWERKVR